nr:MAG TPA: hypothetical protein [Caudoviricetes sp.]
MPHLLSASSLSRWRKGDKPIPTTIKTKGVHTDENTSLRKTVCPSPGVRADAK